MPPKHTPVIPAAEDRLLRTSEAAARLGLTTETLKKYRKAGAGPKFIRLNGRVVRYRLSDLIAYLASKEVCQ